MSKVCCVNNVSLAYWVCLILWLEVQKFGAKQQQMYQEMFLPMQIPQVKFQHMKKLLKL